MNNEIDVPPGGYPSLPQLFNDFNFAYFDGALTFCKRTISLTCSPTSGSIDWSQRLQTSAGVTDLKSRMIKISSIIHQYRTLDNLKETVLHEMIHAFLYDKGTYARGETSHGPSFQRLARQLSEKTGLSITTYHHFTDEVIEAKASYEWVCERCGYAKRGRSKPATKSHNGGCSHVLTRRKVDSRKKPLHDLAKTHHPLFSGPGYKLGKVNGICPLEKGDPRIVQNETVRIPPPAFHKFSGTGYVLGTGSEVLRNAFQARKNNLQMHEFSASRAEAKLNWLKLFDSGLAVDSSVSLSTGIQNARRNGEVNLEQSMATKGLLSYSSSDRQWEY